MTDPFAAIDQAKARFTNSWIKEGVYPLLRVDTIKNATNRKGDALYIVEFQILEDSTAEGHPAGARTTWCVNFRWDSSAQDVKTFLMNLMNSSEDEVTGKVARFTTDALNPCHGRLIRCQAEEVPTKSGGVFTRISWQNVPDAVQEQSDELAKKAGFYV